MRHGLAVKHIRDEVEKRNWQQLHQSCSHQTEACLPMLAQSESMCPTLADSLRQHTNTNVHDTGGKQTELRLTTESSRTVPSTQPTFSHAFPSTENVFRYWGGEWRKDANHRDRISHLRTQRSARIVYLSVVLCPGLFHLNPLQ
jgi:hypothetical protein